MFNAHVVSMIENKIRVLYRERELAFQTGNASDYNNYDRLAQNQYDKLLNLNLKGN